MMETFKSVYVMFMVESLLAQIMLITPAVAFNTRRQSENEIHKQQDLHGRKQYLGEDILLEAKYYELSSNTPFFEDRVGLATDTHSCEHIRGVPYGEMEVWRPYHVNNGFYVKYTEAYGIPVLGSANVEDSSLRRACYVLRFLLADRESLRQAFYAAHSRIAVIAKNEKLRDLPDFDFLPKMFDRSVRALAGTPAIPVTAIGEENLLCFEDDSHRTEDIFVRELAISILLTAVPKVMPKLRDDVNGFYEWAMASDLWQDTFASVSPETYFGEAVQSYFNVNGFSQPPNGEHNEIRTRIALQFYDTGIFDIMTEIFPCGNSLISRCQRRGRGREKHQDLEMNCMAHRGRSRRGR